MVEQSRNTNGNTKSAKAVEDAELTVFVEMCEICLWGNATDLSLLTSLTYHDVQRLQSVQARKKVESTILVNDLAAAYHVLQAARRNGKKERQVDIILGNAGFELFVDLVLAGYLLESGLASQIMLHPKTMPWFVSDVTAVDFQTLLYTLANPNDIFPSEIGGTAAQASLSEAEVESLMFLFMHWSHFHSEGQIILRPSTFWTTAHSYWELPRQEPRLYEDLKQSELVVFKGDLNYRKLTADVGVPFDIDSNSANNGRRRCGPSKHLFLPLLGLLEEVLESARWLSELAEQILW